VNYFVSFWSVENMPVSTVPVTATHCPAHIPAFSSLFFLRRVAAMMLRFPETIIGIKVAHYMFADLDPLIRGIAAGDLAGGKPIMLDWKNLPAPLEMEDLLLNIFRPGKTRFLVFQPQLFQ
jgi:hypothetical protein